MSRTKPDPTPCAVSDCSDPIGLHGQRGYCIAHYARLKRYGDPLGAKPRTTQPVADRLWARTDKTGGALACWIWQGCVKRNGYGAIHVGPNRGQTDMVHRVAWSVVNGRPVPTGMEVDHRCHQPLCVNPRHLQVVTPAQNQENLSGPRGNSRSGVRGVHLVPKTGRWIVRVSKGGVTHRGGTYGSIEEAEAVAIELRNRLMTNNLSDRQRGGLGQPG